MSYTFVRSYRHRLPFEASNTWRVSDDTYESDPGGLRISISERDRVYVVVTFWVRRFARLRVSLVAVFVVFRNRLRKMPSPDDGLDVRVSFGKVVVSLGVNEFVTCDPNGNVCDAYITSVISTGHREVEHVEVPV